MKYLRFLHSAKQFPDKLQAAVVSRVRNWECPWNMNKYRYCFFGSNTTRQNICNGDSGGPCSKNGLLYGVASGGATGCPADNGYSDFVRIFPICDWIYSIISSKPTTEGPTVTPITDGPTVPSFTTEATTTDEVTTTEEPCGEYGCLLAGNFFLAIRHLLVFSQSLQRFSVETNFKQVFVCVMYQYF